MYLTNQIVLLGWKILSAFRLNFWEQRNMKKMQGYDKSRIESFTKMSTNILITINQNQKQYFEEIIHSLILPSHPYEICFSNLQNNCGTDCIPRYLHQILLLIWIKMKSIWFLSAKECGAIYLSSMYNCNWPSINKRSTLKTSAY